MANNPNHRHPLLTPGVNITDCSRNPTWDYKQFYLLDFYEESPYLLVRIKCPECSNFDGLKIVLYEGLSVEEFRSFKECDPHFISENKYSPIARFIPTEKGWNIAMNYLYFLIFEKKRRLICQK